MYNKLKKLTTLHDSMWILTFLHPWCIIVETLTEIISKVRTLDIQFSEVEYK